MILIFRTVESWTAADAGRVAAAILGYAQRRGSCGAAEGRFSNLLRRRDVERSSAPDFVLYCSGSANTKILLAAPRSSSGVSTLKSEVVTDDPVLTATY